MLKILSLLILVTGCSLRQKANPTSSIKNFKDETKRQQVTHAINSNGTSNNKNFLSPVMNDQVNYWLNYYTKNGKNRLQRHFTRGQKYRSDIEAIFKEHGLPKELYYVGIVESGYVLSARSHAQAVGPWQFIKETGQRYGLNVNHVIDERRNIIKATHAAAEFFSDLYNIFGSWELALSAYNAGEYGIIRRIRKAGTRDYYELCEKKAIPKETRNYVPKVLAVQIIDQNPRRYGLKLNNRGSYLTDLKTVSVQGSTSLRNLARKLRINVNTLKKHNPELISHRTPNFIKDDFEILVPKNVKKTELVFRSKSSKRSNRKVASSNYVVRRGDNLEKIARRLGVSIVDLKKANKLRSDRIYPGQRLISRVTEDKPITRKMKTYKVKKGDNLNRIARRFNTTYRKLKSLNSMRKNSIYPGQRLKVPDVEHLTYKVRSGDHLQRIARKFKTSIRNIKKLNGLNNSRIYAGQNLIVSIR